MVPQAALLMKFIDLFAGLGGFHKALSGLGHECVFASEINSELRTLYAKNWGIFPEGDIRETWEQIPNHDVLCAGFPCQPFSKAGKQLGRKDTDHGGLFDYIVEILRAKKPEYFILENVPFIAKHDNEETWNYMRSELENLGYEVDHRNYSPHEFGIPQHRLRIFIVGRKGSLGQFSFEDIDSEKSSPQGVKPFLNGNSTKGNLLPKRNLEQLDLWQELLDALPRDIELPGFPIWAMEFGATYPFEGCVPSRLNSTELGKFKGNFGVPLKNMRKSQQLANLPSYAKVTKQFPAWKKHFIRSNRAFFETHKSRISEVVRKISMSDFPSWQKLEWNVGKTDRRLREYLIQFRASGIRVKNIDYFPSLVCTNTQIPIIGWENRYISRQEGLRLQALDGISLPENDNAAFKALGNAVNSKIVSIIAKHLLTPRQVRTAIVPSAVAADSHYVRPSG
jgi:DNA (cytosine-5)-methyltransferase 1